MWACWLDHTHISSTLCVKSTVNWWNSLDRTRIRSNRGLPRRPRWRSPIWISCLPRSSYRRASTRCRRATRSRWVFLSAAFTTAAIHWSRPSTIRHAMSKSSAGYARSLSYRFTWPSKIRTLRSCRPLTRLMFCARDGVFTVALCRYRGPAKAIYRQQSLCNNQIMIKWWFG